MGSSLSSGRGPGEQNPYATDSPTRTFLSGNALLDPQLSSYWTQLFQEYYILRTSSKVPPNLLKSLDTAVGALSRVLSRPDEVDAINTSTLFRVVIAYLARYAQAATERTSKPPISAQQMCGGLLLLNAVADVLIMSGAGRDRIYLVLGANARRERGSGGGLVLSMGESMAQVAVEGLCDCLIALPPARDADLKSAIVEMLTTLLSTRLYADRTLPSHGLAFLPFFEPWGYRGNNAPRMVSTLLHLAAPGPQKEDQHRSSLSKESRLGRSQSYPDPMSPTSLGGSEFFIRIRHRPSGSRSSIDFGPSSSRSSIDFGQRPPTHAGSGSSASQEDLTASTSAEEVFERPTRRGMMLAKSSLTLVLLLLYGSDQATMTPFSAALAQVAGEQRVSDNPAVLIPLTALFDIARAWVHEDGGMLLMYALLQSGPGFRTLCAENMTKEGTESVLLHLLLDICSVSRMNQPAELSFVSHIVLERLVEVPSFCAELDRLRVPASWLHEQLDICSQQEAQTLCEEGSTDVRLSVALVLVAVQSARRMPADNFLLSLSVAILGNVSLQVNHVVNHAAWSVVTLLDSLSSRYRSYIEGSNTEADVGANGDQTDEDDIEELPAILGTMVEAVAGILVGKDASGEPFVRNGHVLFALLRMRESIFDADSGVTVMVMKNREASTQFRVACSRLSNLIAQAANSMQGEIDALEDDTKMEALLARIKLLPIAGTEDTSDLFQSPKFRYVEDAHALDFFTPYVWSVANFHHMSESDADLTFFTDPTLEFEVPKKTRAKK